MGLLKLMGTDYPCWRLGRRTATTGRWVIVLPPRASRCPAAAAARRRLCRSKVLCHHDGCPFAVPVHSVGYPAGLSLPGGPAWRLAHGNGGSCRGWRLACPEGACLALSLMCKSPMLCCTLDQWAPPQRPLGTSSLEAPQRLPLAASGGGAVWTCRSTAVPKWLPPGAAFYPDVHSSGRLPAEQASLGVRVGWGMGAGCGRLRGSHWLCLFVGGPGHAVHRHWHQLCLVSHVAAESPECGPWCTRQRRAARVSPCTSYIFLPHPNWTPNSNSSNQVARRAGSDKTASAFASVLVEGADTNLGSSRSSFVLRAAD